MLPKVLTAYKNQGFAVDLGSPHRLYSTIVDVKNNRTINCSGGFTVSDAFLFMAVSKLISPVNILVIGNSFGLSTFVLADLFPDARIDAIDAELENLEPQLGSEITRAIAMEDFPNVSLTIGFSPQDLPKAANGKKYNFIFVDAMHTNEAVLADYHGIRDLVEENCLVYFHDVANCNMSEAWDTIKKHAAGMGFGPFEFGFTQMGCTALVKGYPELVEYFKNAANNFDGPYLNGYTSENKFVKYNRPFFWDLSFSQIEQAFRRRMKRTFRR
jgi:predicted O-methyltransferase YrrM